MKRRDTFARLLGKSKKESTAPKRKRVTSLDPYTGPWEFKQAAHLLRRTMFGPNLDQIQTVVNDGLDSTVQQLFTLDPMPEPPINYYFEEDPTVPVGETWTTVPRNTAYSVPRKKSLFGWTVKQILDEGISIREKMTLFWHSHFVTGDLQQWPRYKYYYITTLRENALGNFRELAKKMTVDPMMLRYLNGNLNLKDAPNENYARELLELFTVGKGPIIAPGDYSNYTETDISEMARVLTGWRLVDNNDTGTYIQGVYSNNRHDTGTKQLSHHFNNEVIENAGEEEYKILIDIIFNQSEVARNICRKIYRWFLFYNIDDEIENNVIEPLAQILIDNDYEILPVIETFLKSQHFYEEERIGCMIKNPWDFTISILKQFKVNFPTDPEVYYETFSIVFQGMIPLQMEYYSPPNVAGWKAYYQAPSYYKSWLNSVTLPSREFVVNTFVNFGVPLFVNPSVVDDIMEVDYLSILDNFSNPWEQEVVVDEFSRMLFSRDLAENQKTILQGILTSTWTNEYSNYNGDPTNEMLANSIKSKVKNLILAMMRMPEYQFM